MTMMKKNIELLNKQYSGKDPVEILTHFISEHKGRIVLGSSLGAEDQVITDMIAGIDKSVRIFTLDTGRLFPETYDLIEKTNQRYGITIELFFPDRDRVENMVAEQGINLFYRSVENRKLCCHIRKVEPSKRALKDVDIWITGIRKDQTLSRFYNATVEWDDHYKLTKVNPLFGWNQKKVWDYIRQHDVPYNVLHDKGFPSIGCQPCTRAVEPGEDLRAGRWWWEQADYKECGLHNNPHRLVRE